ncbi:MAG: hypothetical protein ICV83_03910 [Cytophagales bacterium]|nr:hypothetical protein [Cytophagales bacterium]
MGYLDKPRLVFSGDFQADVSTVNNDVRHYDNGTFEPRFQQPQEGKTLNGWWNPGGGATFAFVDCTVRGACYEDGTETTDASQEWIIGQAVSQAAGVSPGKMVDIDPQMQMCSQLWAVKLRLGTATGELILQGDVAVTGFRDLQGRQVGQHLPNRQPLGASWTTVLENVVWGKAADRSKLLGQLRSHAQEGCLSLNLSAFGYYYTHNDGRFSMGRLLGTIGPCYRHEPRLFAPARRLIGLGAAPAFGYSNFIYGETEKRLTVDLGNSFPVTDPLGTAADVGTLRLAVSTRPAVDVANTEPVLPADRIVIGDVGYGAPGWLLNTAGIVALPVPDAAAALLPNHQLLLLSVTPDGQEALWACETAQGLAVRADGNIQRIDPGETARVNVYAYQWGKPLANCPVSFALAPPTQDGGGPGTDPAPPPAPIPETGLPVSALHFPATVTTNAAGVAELTIRGDDPKNPRGYLDGQIYQILYAIDGLPPGQQYFNDRIIVHLRDGYTVPDPVAWADVQPILTQYGNLYPIMSKHIVDLTDADAVRDHWKILLFAFTRDINDPHYMPVTRDLSEAKRQAIIRWLRSVAPPLAAATPKATEAGGLPEPVQRRMDYEQTHREAIGQLRALKGGAFVSQPVKEES